MSEPFGERGGGVGLLLCRDGDSAFMLAEASGIREGFGVSLHAVGGLREFSFVSES